MEKRAPSNSVAKGDITAKGSLKKWLGGIGAGSWFAFRQTGQQLHISRFSDSGELECEGLFKAVQTSINWEGDFEITYPSHCAKVTLLQEGQKLIYLRRNSIN